jgi:hypothetical protein
MGQDHVSKKLLSASVFGGRMHLDQELK